MIILGIESSCDDTSVALVDITNTTSTVLAEKTASQIEVHKKYGGVVPEIAGRKHAENILPVVEEVLREYPKKPDAIAVTSGPGLVTGLLVGVEVAKNLSHLWNIPLVSMNHIDGHMQSVTIGLSPELLVYPALSLVVSGGHTELIFMRKLGVYECIGTTRDDAAGEAFDKVAKLLDLAYPGGPKISAFATDGDTKKIPFPRPMMDSDNFDFSFAGLKTAALYWLQNHKIESPVTPESFLHQGTVTINDFCASFEQAIVDVLVSKTLRAVQQYAPKTVILSGGVSANNKLRETLKSALAEQHSDVLFLFPEKKYCMDNAAMIAIASYEKVKQQQFTNWKDIIVNPNWRVYQQ